MQIAGKTKKVIVVVGPTAVGKTKLAIRLAKHLDTQIVSADSRQCYKEMSIGTAKPSNEELKEVPHHFIGCKPITEGYNAVQYGQEALNLIDQLLETNECVILCGGAGMYVKAVCEGFDAMPPIPPKISAWINDEYEKKGLKWLQKQVFDNDPDFFLEVDQKNPRRLIRALELISITKKPIKSLRKNIKQERPFAIIKIGLELGRQELYHEIEARVERMMERGLLEEVRGLFPYRAHRALQTVGYRELFGYLAGDYSLEEAINLLKQNTRKYAKRQLTWFKKDTDIKWFHPHAWDKVRAYIGC